MKAHDICKTAANLVSGDRDRQHGKKLENFKNIALLWSAYLGIEIQPHQVALMMVLMKVARTKTGENNDDDYIDICGYGGCAGEIAETKENTKVYSSTIKFKGTLVPVPAGMSLPDFNTCAEDLFSIIAENKQIPELELYRKSRFSQDTFTKVLFYLYVQERIVSFSFEDKTIWQLGSVENEALNVTKDAEYIFNEIPKDGSNIHRNNL